MLGEKLGQLSGKVTGQQVLPSDSGAPTVETSFQQMGQMLGVQETDVGTYRATMRPDGTLFGEGQGFVMGKGGETATWTGQGVGIFNADGSISFRGALYYQSAHPKWARLNRVAAVFEYQQDATGNTAGSIWEWK